MFENKSRDPPRELGLTCDSLRYGLWTSRTCANLSTCSVQVEPRQRRRPQAASPRNGASQLQVPVAQCSSAPRNLAYPPSRPPPACSLDLPSEGHLDRWN
ncbi:hypothetical protein FIBSPDRAFT_963833 [Athelia psychrophila]|uniref:Uncharacterized protein n=1 Tax=Athelia psychrophila TaxID=1759441 RepID=A0A165YJN5_9AGAM|nr:hypothetical protein FIBSPDRAFT_963833 [Fibularhizoctonia sp. CBS 109695]